MRMSKRLRVGTVLSISSRTSLRSREMSPRFSARRTAAMRVRRTFSFSSWPKERTIAKTIRATRKKVTIATRPAGIYDSSFEYALLMHDLLHRGTPRGRSSNASTVRSVRALEFEHGRRKLNAGDRQALRETRAHAAGHEVSHHFAVILNAPLAIDEDVLHGDDVAFHAGDLRDAGDFTGTVAKPANLNNDVDGRSDLTADRGVGQIQAGHSDHGL